MATRSPNASRNCAATAGVSAISGTSIKARPSRITRRGGEPEVDLGLAAAGDAVQQRNFEGAAVSQRPQPIDRRGLLSCQGSDPGSDRGRNGSRPLSDPCPTHRRC